MAEVTCDGHRLSGGGGVACGRRRAYGATAACRRRGRRMAAVVWRLSQCFPFDRITGRVGVLRQPPRQPAAVAACRSATTRNDWFLLERVISVSAWKSQYDPRSGGYGSPVHRGTRRISAISSASPCRAGSKVTRSFGRLVTQGPSHPVILSPCPQSLGHRVGRSRAAGGITEPPNLIARIGAEYVHFP
jgi:hypothetical protein